MTLYSKYDSLQKDRRRHVKRTEKQEIERPGSNHALDSN